MVGLATVVAIEYMWLVFFGIGFMWVINVPMLSRQYVPPELLVMSLKSRLKYVEEAILATTFLTAFLPMWKFHRDGRDLDAKYVVYCFGVCVRGVVHVVAMFFTLDGFQEFLVLRWRNNDFRV